MDLRKSMSLSFLVVSFMAHSGRVVLVYSTDCKLFLQGLLRVRGRPAVAYDQQGLVFSVAMEGGAIKLFDVRSYDKVSNSLNL